MATENIKRSRRISLRTIAPSCAKYFCFGFNLTSGFGPFSGLAIPCKDFDRVLGYPLAAFSFDMPYLAGWKRLLLIHPGGEFLSAATDTAVRGCP